MSNKRFIPKLISILLPITALIPIFFKENFLALVLPLLPSCYFYNLFHLYCPSCGNTRSVISLLHGEVLSSLRFNIVPILLTVLLLLSYIEFVTYSFGKQVRLLPRKLSFYLILIACLILYWIVRNFIPYLTP
ncbi:MAG: hypothetical protein K0S04_3326 [Herbinix sp.]|nr:hypothetical protein [Herbinix sp.]